MWLPSRGLNLFLGAGVATLGSRAVQRQGKRKNEILIKVTAATLTWASRARYDEVRGHLINVTTALDRALQVLITWQCFIVLYPGRPSPSPCYVR